jgi:hypothetical protein
MKTLFLTAALGVVCVSGFAQGTFAFQNFGLGANAPVYDTDGVTKLGSAFEADLYWQAGTWSDSAVLNALGQPVRFSGSGYFLGGNHTITGTGAQTITAQVRVWDTAAGSSWDAANTVVGAKIGESALFSLTLVTGTTPPNALVNLQSFNLRPVPAAPEPSALALAGFGLAAMLLLRRRR